jgi:Protein of unknown function (DUF2946)
MLSHRLRIGAIAAWLGVIALGFNALVPIHLAFDLAHALAPDRHGKAAAADHDLIRCLLTLVIGHHDENQDQSPAHKGRHQTDCAVCSAVGNLAGFAPAAAAPLAAPILGYAPPPPAIEVGAPHTAPLVAYRSRAPPLA